MFGNVKFRDENHIASILDQKLGKSDLCSRPGPHGRKLHYIESCKAIELANEAFGFNGWSCKIVDCKEEYRSSTVNGNVVKWQVGYSAQVYIQLKDGTSHEDIGFGQSDGLRDLGQSIEIAKKGCISDARKRTLRLFGEYLGNSCYDKEHMKDVRNNRYVATPVMKRSHSDEKIGNETMASLPPKAEYSHSVNSAMNTPIQRNMGHGSNAYGSHETLGNDMQSKDGSTNKTQNAAFLDRLPNPQAQKKSKLNENEQNPFATAFQNNNQLGNASSNRIKSNGIRGENNGNAINTPGQARLAGGNNGTSKERKVDMMANGIDHFKHGQANIQSNAYAMPPSGKKPPATLKTSPFTYQDVTKQYFNGTVDADTSDLRCSQFDFDIVDEQNKK